MKKLLLFIGRELFYLSLSGSLLSVDVAEELDASGQLVRLSFQLVNQAQQRSQLTHLLQSLGLMLAEGE